MQEYTEALTWYAMWPILIYVAYRFVLLNLKHHSKMERLEELEAHYANENKNITKDT